jgi:NTE family protein
VTRALVLGGGGPVGIAWEAGLVAGLVEAGIDLSQADLIVGTSAGSVVGAQLAMGLTPAAVVAPYTGGDLPSSPSERLSTPPDLTPLIGKLMESYAGERPAVEVYKEIGAWALAAQTMSEEDFVGSFRLSHLPAGYWPPKKFSCTAVGATSGEFVEWNQAAGVALERAVASSCAVPGVYPPITINGQRYVDGGMRSGTNADLAKGYDVVVIVAVSSAALPEVFRRPLDREMKVLGESGSRIELIRPDAESLASFGPNLMDARMRPAAAANGIRQGKAGLESLKTLWG